MCDFEINKCTTRHLWRCNSLFHCISFLAYFFSLASVQDVRKAIVLSLPPSNATSAAIIDRTLDISESVRKAAYFSLASKFPLQSLR